MARPKPHKRPARPAPKAHRPYGGIGLWYAAKRPVAEGQAASAIEQGMWAVPQFAHYPGASLKAAYQIAIEITDDSTNLSSANFLPRALCDPKWICTYQGQPLHSYDGTNWLGDLGNAAYREACARAGVEKCKKLGIKAVYIDNMHGAVSLNSLGGVIPDGYANDDDWRNRAAIPFLIAVGSRLREAGVYVYANAGDKPLIGSKEDLGAGDATYRYWGQIHQAEIAAGKVAVDGLFTEYFMQRPTDNGPYRAGGGSWDANAPGWQRLVARAQALGKDFHGLVYSNGGSAERYARGAFLLDADLANRKSTLWSWSLEDPKLALHPGAALGGRFKIGAVDARRFENFTVYVNMTASPQNAHGLAVPPLDTVFVTTRI